jgi:enoyl-CoA hydratase/carnithine racemase
MSAPILIAREGAIATVTLNNPERLNALDRAAWQAMGDALLALAEDATVRCIVLRGSGTEAFAAGANIAEFAGERSDARQAYDYDQIVHRATRAVARCPHPTVAMIMGPCVGGGLEIAALCDLRIAGESSRFGIPINRLGFTLAYEELAALIALVGRAVTLEILLEGRVFGAAEALQKGLITRVVADDAVEAEALAAARRIADGAPLVNRWHKDFVRRLERGAPTPAEDEASYACYETEDFREGVAAFLAKRKPQFRGR